MAVSQMWRETLGVVEAFIKCSSGPGEALVNVPIICGVGQRLALCPNDSCLMHLCSPCHLTSPLEVAGRGGLAKSSHKAREGQSGHAVILHLLSICLTWGRLLHVWPVAAQSPHSKPSASHRVNLNSRVVRVESVALSEALCYSALCILCLNA